MDPFQSLMRDAGGAIAHFAMERLSDDLAHTVAKMRAAHAPKPPSMVSLISAQRQLTATPEEPRDPKGMFDKLASAREASKSSGKSMLEEFLERTETPKERGARVEREVIIKPARQAQEVQEPAEPRVMSPKPMPLQPATSSAATSQQPQNQPFWSSWQKSPVPEKQKVEKLEVENLELNINKSEPQSPERPKDYVGSFFNAIDRYSAKFFNNIGFGKIAHDPDDDIAPRSPVSIKPTPNQGAAGPSNTASPSSPRAEKTEPAASSGFISRLIASFASKRATRDRADYGQRWWQPGFGKSRGPKRNGAVRAARLKMMAQTRADSAARAEKAIEITVGTPGYDPAKHKEASAASTAAQERLGQATALEAKATSAGAQASGRLAGSIEALGSNMTTLASRLALPVAVGAFVARIPWMVRDANDARIAALRNQGEYRGETAAIGTLYDRMTDRINAMQVRDTAATSMWLVNEQNKLRMNLQPINSLVTNATSATMALGTHFLNKGLEYEQSKFDFGMAMGQEAWNAVRGGRIPDFAKNVPDMMKDAREKREAEFENKDLAEKPFSGNLFGWEEALKYRGDNVVLGREPARQNALPKKPLPKF